MVDVFKVFNAARYAAHEPRNEKTESQAEQRQNCQPDCLPVFFIGFGEALMLAMEAPDIEWRDTRCMDGCSDLCVHHHGSSHLHWLSVLDCDYWLPGLVRLEAWLHTWLHTWLCIAGLHHWLLHARLLHVVLLLRHWLVGVGAIGLAHARLHLLLVLQQGLLILRIKGLSFDYARVCISFFHLL